MFSLQQYPVYTIVDNINIDTNNGDLWIGSIPNYEVTSIHEHDPTLSIPVASQVTYTHTHKLTQTHT